MLAAKLQSVLTCSVTRPASSWEEAGKLIGGELAGHGAGQRLGRDVDGGAIGPDQGDLELARVVVRHQRGGEADRDRGAGERDIGSCGGPAPEAVNHHHLRLSGRNVALGAEGLARDPAVLDGEV